MFCTICGTRDFTSAVYRTGSRLAPALQCKGCGALTLSEGEATSQEERDAIRIAISGRSVLLVPDTLVVEPWMPRTMR